MTTTTARSVGAHEPGADTSRAYRQISAVLAVGTLIVLGAQIHVQYTITAGAILALALAPLWISALPLYRGARLFVFAGLAVLLSGLWLSELTKADHVVATQYVISDAAILLGLVLTTCVVLWARTVVPLWTVGLSYGLGLAAGLFLNGGPSDVNVWKFGYALPTIVLVLSAVAALRRRRPFEIVALLALAVFSALNDSRSLFAELGLTATLVIWQLIPRGRTLKVGIARTLVAFAAAMLAAYNVGTSLLIDGYLGAEAQTRTVQQIDESGSVILGGRPEIAGSTALLEARPWGYGLGVKPSLADITTAKAGMKSINYEPNNGYVEKYMFGTTFELHSVTADLWAAYGIPGLAFAGMLLFLLVRWLAIALAQREAPALTIFLSILSMWNLFFSPLYTSAVTLAFAIGITMLRREAGGAHSPLPERGGYRTLS